MSSLISTPPSCAAADQRNLVVRCLSGMKTWIVPVLCGSRVRESNRVEGEILTQALAGPREREGAREGGRMLGTGGWVGQQLAI